MKCIFWKCLLNEYNDDYKNVENIYNLNVKQNEILIDV